MLPSQSAQKRRDVLLATEEDLGVLGLEREQSLVGTRLRRRRDDRTSLSRGIRAQCTAGQEVVDHLEDVIRVATGLSDDGGRDRVDVDADRFGQQGQAFADQGRDTLERQALERDVVDRRHVAQVVAAARQREEHQPRRPGGRERRDELERARRRVLEVVQHEQHGVGRRRALDEPHDGVGELLTTRDRRRRASRGRGAER